MNIFVYRLPANRVNASSKAIMREVSGKQVSQKFMRVIVPIDDTPSAQPLIDALMGIRWRPGSQIKLLSVLKPLDGGTNVESSAVADIENLAVELHKALSHCEVSLLVRQGDPADEIIAHAEEFGAELIVMGSNCKTGLQRLLLGSVSQSVLNRADCPVMIARFDSGSGRNVQLGFKTVLIPIDNSPFSDVAVRWLSNFCWDSDAKFILATVVESVPTSVTTASSAEAAEVVEQNRDILEPAVQSLKERAKELASLLQNNNVFVEFGAGEPTQSIVNLATTYSADLIVMGSHGRTGLKKLILGSVSQSVSQEASCSVAIVRGILPSDESWQKTGVFKKPKVEQPLEDAIKRVKLDKPKRRSDVTPHILPGGMG